MEGRRRGEREAGGGNDISGKGGDGGGGGDRDGKGTQLQSSTAGIMLYGDISNGVGGHSRGGWSIFDAADLHGAVTLHEGDTSAAAGSSSPNVACSVDAMEALSTVTSQICMFEAEEVSAVLSRLS
jgi:hypothetical protein